MSRAVAAIDRLAAALAGAAFLVGGLALLAWTIGWPDDLVDGWPDRISVDAATDLAERPWWPWAAGIGGIVVGLVMLRWLWAHLPHRPARTAALSGSDEHGRLRVDVQATADAAAAELAHMLGARNYRGRVRRDRGRTVIDLTVTVGPEVDQREAVDAADEVGDQTAAVLGPGAPPIRVHLHVHPGEED